MSSLDSKTLKDFAQAILGDSAAPSSLRYGTVTTDASGTYVLLDGSSTYTPAIVNADVRTGDRVSVDFINHKAVILANMSNPTSGYVATEQPTRVYTEYAKNGSPTLAPTSGWTETLPAFGPGEYVWSRIVNEYSDGHSVVDTPRVIYGDKVSGEASAVMTMTTSNGTSFRDSTTNTTISIRITKGSTIIDNWSKLVQTFGTEVRLIWYYKHVNGDWAIITDGRILQSGFQLYVDQTSVNVSTTFRCEASRVIGGTQQTICLCDVTIDDINDGFTHGLTTYTYTFRASTPDGADVGDQCQTTIYFYSGSSKKNITITSSDVVCPSGIRASIVGSGTQTPIITFTVTSKFASSREAQITYHYGDYVFIQHFSFSVAMKGDAGLKGDDGIDGVDGFSCGIRLPYYAFSGKAVGGVPSGSKCTAELYAMNGRLYSLVEVSASDIECPTGISVEKITNSGTTSPIIHFVTTAALYTGSTALIHMHAHGSTYTVVMAFGVVLDGAKGEKGDPGEDGTDGVDGKDGENAYSLTITSSDGTTFTDREEETTLTLTAKYGNTTLTINESGYVYNGSLYIGRSRWILSGKSGYSYGSEITIGADEVLPVMLVTAQFYNTSMVTKYAETDITLAFCANIKVAQRYYQKVNTSSNVPSKPTAFPPPSPWTLTEPSVTESEVSTKTIYYVEVVQYSNNTFVYSDVSEYTAFVSSKFALTKALAALTTANDADANSEEAKQDAYDALIAATAFLKLDPVLQKIVISKLGTNGWKTFAVDSTGCSIGEYNPVNSTFTEYQSFDIKGIHITPRRTGSGDTIGGYFSMDEDNSKKSNRNQMQYCVEVATKVKNSSDVRDDAIYETSNANVRLNTSSNQLIHIVSAPNSTVQARKGSSYSFLCGGEDKTGLETFVAAPGFAVGTVRGTLPWLRTGMTNAIPDLTDQSANLAKQTGIGVVAVDTDSASGSSNNRLFGAPYLSVVGIANNTQRKRWPEFWCVNASSGSAATNANAHVPLFGFRGLTNQDIVTNTSAQYGVPFTFYVSSSTSTALVLRTVIPVAYPITTGSTITVTSSPPDVCLTNGKNVSNQISIRSIAAAPYNSNSGVVLTLTCESNSSYTIGCYVGYFNGSITITIT